MILTYGRSIFMVSSLILCGALYSSRERTPDYPVDEFIMNRWSARAMSGEAVTKSELMSLFEAARWAPSSYNGQPWRFIYGLKDTQAWEKIFKLLVPFNQSWVQQGGALVLVVSANDFDHGNPAATHSFDTGAACENMALQGAAKGLVVHGMSGFDYAAARAEFAIPDNYTVEAIFCIGKPGSIDKLPRELQEREVPSSRKKVSEFAREGKLRK